MRDRSKRHDAPGVPGRTQSSDTDSPSTPASSQAAGVEGQPPGPSVLLVEDFEPVLNALEISLKRAGFEILAARSGDEALQIAQSKAVDLLLTDIQMPRMSGIDLARQLRHQHPQIPVVFLSGGVHLEAARHTLWGGPLALLKKPCATARLIATLNQMLGTSMPVN